MTGHRKSLPQLDGGFFLTDGGIETTLIFLEGLELPDFAAFDLFRRKGGEAALRKYFRTYAALAQRFGAGKVVISGCIGPRGDGYTPGRTMSEEDTQAYHDGQVRVFADSAADMVTAITMNTVEEAIGIARAAERAGMPAAISFTVETDGRLPTGQGLGAAIEQVDAATSGYPSYYMINCAHPTHFEPVLAEAKPWARRIRGLRANASRKSHAELNESPELDIGNPAELGEQHAALKRRHSQLNVMGGCCGTDHRHIEEIAAACAPLFR